MKHTKRLLSVALAVMLFVSMFAGMAAADGVKPTIIKIKSFHTNGSGYTYTFNSTTSVPYFWLNDYNAIYPEFTDQTTAVASWQFEEVKWSISDPSFGSLAMDDSRYCEFDNGGTWAGRSVPIPVLRLTKKTGDVKITATNQDGTIKAEWTLTLKSNEVAPTKNPVEKINFTQSEYYVKKNTWPLTYLEEDVYWTVTRQDPTGGWEGFTTSWTSDDKSVLTVDDGMVEPHKVGSANVTLTVKNNVSKTKVSATVKVTVLDNPVTKITFDPAEYTMEIGESANIYPTMTAEPEGVGTTPNDLTLLSSDPSVVRVNGTSITAAGPGEATVTAMYYNEFAKTFVTGDPIKVKVTEVPVTELKFAVESVNLAKGGAAVDLEQFVFMTPDEGASSYTKDNIEWSSSDITVATVDGDGDVRAVAPGEATITAKLYNKVAKTTVKATVAVKVLEGTTPVEAVAFTQESFKMTLGDPGLSLSDYVQIDPANHEEIIATFTTSDYAVAAVNQWSGDVVARGVGEATITLSVYNTVSKTTVEATTKIVVTAATPATAIAAKPAKFTVTKGDDLLWTAENYLVVTPADACDYDIRLTSADDDIVSIDWDEYYGGYDISANQVGTADVTVTLYNNTEKTYLTTTFTVEVVDAIPLKGIAFKKESYTVKLDNTPTRNISGQVKADPVNAYWYGYNQIWESSDMEIATVDSNGTVTAKGIGTATITLTLLNESGATVATASTTVKTEVVPVTKASFNKKQVRLYFAATDNEDYNTFQTLSVAYQPSNAYVKRIDWETTDAAVAIVGDLYSKDGSSVSTSTKVVATGLGNCIVTAKVITLDANGNEVEITQKIEVLVSSKTVDLKLNESKLTMNLQKDEIVAFQLEATDDLTGDPVVVRWKSSDPKVAKVDAYGQVIALKEGTAIITATTKDGNKTTATCEIKVQKLKIKKIKVAKKLKMKVGQTEQPEITIKPAGAFNTKLKFTSSAADIVKVDEDGTLTALAKGKAVITIQATDGSKKSAKITVTVE